MLLGVRVPGTGPYRVIPLRGSDNSGVGLALGMVIGLGPLIWIAAGSGGHEAPRRR